MLKIKDGIDLKELERFGFKKCGDMYICKLEFDYACDIIIGDKKIAIEIDGEVGYYECDEYNDILYDLIKSDMVEKECAE